MNKRTNTEAALPSLWIAQLETRNFEFHGLGRDKGEALAALERGLTQHGKDYLLPRNWFNEFKSDYSLFPIAVGGCLRDRELLGTKEETLTEPDLQWFAITGRIPGDDEDSCRVFHVATRDEALAAFAEALWADEADNEAAREAAREDVRKTHGQDCFINSVVRSDTEITDIG